MIRKHIFFTGRVQGVGFRYQSAAIACSMGLTGWVRNLSDGRVEMEVQGEEPKIARLILELKNTPYIHIDRAEAENIPCDESEKKFQTRFTHSIS